MNYWSDENRANAIIKAQEITREQYAFRNACKPRHARRHAEFSREWFEAQDTAFCKAMALNPGERPSGHDVYNAAGRGA